MPRRRRVNDSMSFATKPARDPRRHVTAWELAQQGIPAPNHRRQRRRPSDAARRNRPGHRGQRPHAGPTGEVANKSAPTRRPFWQKRHGIPFYVAIPLSTIDWNLKRGFDIPIEERDGAEVLGAWGIPGDLKSAISNLRQRPATFGWRTRRAGRAIRGFDVTPPELITGIITPAGIFEPKELWSRRRRIGFCE